MLLPASTLSVVPVVYLLIPEDQRYLLVYCVCLQDSDDDAPMLLKVAAAAAGADADLDSITANAESIRQLPPVGSIRFQPSSEYIMQHKPTAGLNVVYVCS